MVLCNTLLVCLLVTFTAVVESAHNNTAVDELLEWFRSKGGYFNPKQEIRQDSDGSFGVFAVQDIEEDELLTSVPWECVIRAEDTVVRFANCATVKVLAEELRKDVKSPYVQGLEMALQSHAQMMPINWSPRGKELLLQVTGNGVLPPTHFSTKYFKKWKHECDQVSKDATALMITHGEEFGMSPVTDKYNHGLESAYVWQYGNDDEVAQSVYAHYSIKAGEQIFTNYREDYGAMGTAELLEQFGFVENYPRRFIFRDPLFAFDIDEADSGDLEVTWLIPPNDEAVKFLQEQLERLKSVYLDLQQQQQQRLLDDTETTGPPMSELEVITQYCTACITAMEHALQSDLFDGNEFEGG